jgi:hypothetical protein
MGTRISVVDLIGLTSRSIDEDGYMSAPAVISTSDNVQKYRAADLGLTDRPPDEMVGLYRPTDEVMDPETLASFDGKPITMNHPPGGVSAKNWKQVAIGDVHDVKAAGKNTAARVVIRDSASVGRIASGKSALSCGYSFDLDLTPGVASDGTPYIGVQRKIRGNHTAIVDVPRGGPVCRIADNAEEKPMALRKLVLDGIAVEVEDRDATIIEKAIAVADAATKAAQDAATQAGQALAKAQADLATEQAKTTKLVADHAAALAEVTAKIPTPAQLQAMATELSVVVGDAAKLAPAVVPAGKSAHAIRTETLAAIVADGASTVRPVALAVLAGVDVAKAEPGSVKAAFDACVAAGAVKVSDAAAINAHNGRALSVAGSSGTAPAKLTGRALAMANMRTAGNPAKA